MTSTEKMKILIGADIVPTQNSIKYFEEADLNSLIGEQLERLLQQADVRIFNLEVPLTDVESPIEKCGPNLRAPTSSIKGIKALNPTYLSLANNHIMDHGAAGLNSTFCALDSVAISFGGAGANIEEASKGGIIDCHGIKLGVYSCAEHEFSIAGKCTCGANPFDLLESYDHVRHLKGHCDYVIVLYHGGKELYRYPSPDLQNYCRKFIDSGAGLVVCQHSHCIGCEEKYNDGTIVYGQGNFLFDKRDNEFWNSSLLIELTISKDENRIEYIPLERKTPGARMAQNEKAEMILSDFRNRSVEITQKGFIRQRHAQHADDLYRGYILGITGDYWTLPFRIKNKLLGNKAATEQMLNQRYSKETLLAIQNFIECEAHRELLLQGIKQQIARLDTASGNEGK